MSYRIFANDGSGGPIDWSSPIATVPSPPWTSGPLAFPGDHSFGARRYDATANLDDGSVQAKARIVLDADGVDITAIPKTPENLTADLLPAAKARIAWRAPGADDCLIWWRDAALWPPLPGDPPDLVITDPKLILEWSAEIQLAGGVEWTIGVAGRKGTLVGPLATINISPDSTAPSDPILTVL